MAALPSGSDPTQFDLGVWGIVGAGMTAFAGRDQDAVSGALKVSQIQDSPSWGDTSTFLFEGLQAALGFPVAFLKAIVENLFGSIIGSDTITDLLDLLGSFLDDIPIIGDLYDAITGTHGGGDMGDLSDFFTDFLAIFGNPTGLGTGSPTIVDVLEDIPILGPLVDALLNGSTAVSSSSLFGSIPPWILDFLGLGALSNNADVNYLANPVFTDASSIVGGGDWVWNSATHGSAGGSASVSGDGTEHDLYSGPMSASAGQQVPMSIYAEWTSLVCTGTPVQLIASSFYQGVEVISSILDEAGATGTSDWVQLNGTYTVPSVGADSIPIQVDEVRMVLHLGSTASAGVVNFSDGSMTKQTAPGTAPLEWIDGLIDSLFGGDSAWQNQVDTFVNSFLGMFGIGHDPSSVADAVNANVDTVAGTSAQMIQVLTALGTGTPDADDFERFSLTDLGANWTIKQTGSGTLATGDSHNASWGGIADAEFVAYKNNVSALTDNQTVTVVLGSAPAFSPPWGPSEFGWNYLWLRMTSFTTWATRTGLRMGYSANKTWELRWFNGGTGTLLFSGPMTVVPGNGAVLEFTAGTLGDPTRLIAKFNNAVLLDDHDTGAVSTYGGTQRRRGLGGQMNTGLLTGIAGPGNFKQWAAQG